MNFKSACLKSHAFPSGMKLEMQCLSKSSASIKNFVKYSFYAGFKSRKLKCKYSKLCYEINSINNYIIFKTLLKKLKNA